VGAGHQGLGLHPPAIKTDKEGRQLRCISAPGQEASLRQSPPLRQAQTWRQAHAATTAVWVNTRPDRYGSPPTKLSCLGRAATNSPRASCPPPTFPRPVEYQGSAKGRSRVVVCVSMRKHSPCRGPEVVGKPPRRKRKASPIGFDHPIPAVGCALAGMPITPGLNQTRAPTVLMKGRPQWRARTTSACARASSPR
jgi:hypothetical protein